MSVAGERASAVAVLSCPQAGTVVSVTTMSPCLHLDTRYFSNTSFYLKKERGESSIVSIRSINTGFRFHHFI